MDSILCDELVQEIFRRLPPSSSSAVSLVSKKWLRLFRSSTVALYLCFSYPVAPPSLSNFLSHHSFLSSLSVTTTSTVATGSVVVSPDFLLNSVVSSCPNLRQLCFFTEPVSLLSLFSLSTSCPRLSSLSITLSRPLVFGWLAGLRFLKELSIVITGNSTESQSLEFNFPDSNPLTESLQANLNIKKSLFIGM